MHHAWQPSKTYIFNQTIKLFTQNSQCIAGYHQFFISRDNSYCHFRVISRDNSLFSTNLVLFKVNLHTHEFQTFTNFGTAVYLVFAYSTSEQNNIYST